jgi:pyruvate ferredoxin oxidoreductase gamma subunit
MLKEIRVHGRGGQGSVTAAEVLAKAAFKDGLMSQAFPAFGSERMGAPVRAFCRVSDKPIRNRSEIHAPDYCIVQDPTLLETVNVFEGLKSGGMVMLNSEKPETVADKVPAGATMKAVAGSRIAMEVIGKNIPNMIMVGAFAGSTGLVTLESLKAAVKERFGGKVGDLNAEAVEKAYKAAKEQK